MTDWIALIRWVAVLAGIQLLLAGPARRIFGRQGAILGSLLFVLLWTYLYWLWGSLFELPERNVAVYGSGFAAYVTIYFASRVVRMDPEPDSSLSVGGEISFWFLFAAAVLIRAFEPDIAQTEKFSDISVLQAVLLDRHFPPEDRWLSGLPINYYYFAQLLFVPIIKVSRVLPEYAFNLSVCTVAAWTGSSAYAFCRQISRNEICAVGAALASIVLSNFEWIRQWLSGQWARGFSWWDSSRLMPGTITEFPYFSYLLGDFHAHYVALPFLTLTLAVALRLRSALRMNERMPLLVFIVLGALTIGVHYPLNPWQLPWVALVVGFLLIRHQKALIATGFLSILAYLPYWISFERRAGSIQWVPSDLRSPLLLFAAHWAIFLFPIGFLLAKVLPKLSRRQAIVWSGLCIASVVFGGAAFGLCILLLVVFGAWKKRELLEEPESLLFLLAVFAVLSCEVIYLYEIYGPEFKRLNTVFKFYMVAWWAFSIAVPLLIWRNRDLFFAHKRAAVTILAAILLAGLVYPIVGTPKRVGGFRGPASLDGMKYWTERFPGERDAVEWLRSHTKPSDHIFEAEGYSFDINGRFAAFSGRPTLLAWKHHQSIWRDNADSILGPRQADVDRLNREPSKELLAAWARTYDIRYVIVGSLERRQFSKPLLDLLATYPERFASSTTQIFDVRP